MSTDKAIDRVVLIAGSSPSFGLASLRAFSRVSASVIIDRAFGDHLNKTGPSLDATKVKVSKHGAESSGRIVDEAVSSWKRIDVVIYSAFPVDSGNISISDNDHWERAISVELKNAFKLAKAVWPIFRKQKFGRLVLHAGSSLGIFSLLGFAQTLSKEGAKYNIAVNVVAPTVPSHIAGTPSGDSVSIESLDISDLLAMLSDKTANEHSGSLFIVSQSGTSKMRWERTAGIMVNPDKAFSAETVRADWENVRDFSNVSHPDGAMDFANLLPKALILPPNEPATKSIRFDGKTAIVTGAAAGLGRCYALELARRGANVVVNDLADPAEVVKEIESHGGTAIGVQASCDAGDEIVQAAIERFGRVDIVINNAGFLRDKSFGNMAEENWDAVINVHINGTYQMTRAVWPYFRRQRSGSIVNTSSTSGIYGHFGQANYSTGKLGIVGITEAAAKEGSAYGIRVNAVAPVASTAALASAWKKTDEAAKDTVMKPEYNVPTVVLLCSQTSSGRDTRGLYEIGCGNVTSTRLRPSQIFPISPPLLFHTNDIGAMVSESLTSDPTSVRKRIKQRQGVEFGHTQYTFDRRDVILYNLSVGAHSSNLQYVYEDAPDFQAIPTFGVLPFFSPTVISHHAEIFPDFRSNGKVVLGEHYLEILGNIMPTSGRLRSVGQLLDVVDKGSAAIARSGYTTFREDTGEKVFYNEVSFFIGGAGGFSGTQKQAKQPRRSSSLPTRKPDSMTVFQTSTEQAALYRLSGDYEAIHIDPAASLRAGLPTPILHGLCTMGIAAREIHQRYGPFRSIRARFVGAVVPGAKLKTEMWNEGGRILFQTSDVTMVSSAKLCIADGEVELASRCKAKM